MAATKKQSPKKKKPAVKKAAAKKTAGKKAAAGKKVSKTAGRPDTLKEFKKMFLGLAILVSLCLTAAMIADIFINPGDVGQKKPELSEAAAPEKKQPKEVAASPKVIRKKIPPKTIHTGADPQVPADHAQTAREYAQALPDGMIEYEIFKDVDHGAVEKPVPPSGDHTPRIALIIDDIGYDQKVAMALIELDPNITFSVLPFSPFGRKISEHLLAKGAQLMLHLPMQPVEYPKINPGPGAILTAMGPDELLDQLRKDIRQIPNVRGVNNHMGSELTLHADKMNQIFTILKKKDLFFIDSRTAAKSQCHASARLLKVRFAQRDVFLDNFQNIDYITGQFKELIRIAEKHGTAIGIGHPYPATLETLKKEIPKLKNKIRIVRAEALTHIPG